MPATLPMPPSWRPCRSPAWAGSGPVRSFALGDLLVVTTPKNRAGIATVDISDPLHPVLLDCSTRAPAPTSAGSTELMPGSSRLSVASTSRLIRQTSDTSTAAVPASEYQSWADDHLFLGGLRGGTVGDLEIRCAPIPTTWFSSAGCKAVTPAGTTSSRVRQGTSSSSRTTRLSGDTWVVSWRSMTPTRHHPPHREICESRQRIHRAAPQRPDRHFLLRVG